MTDQGPIENVYICNCEFCSATVIVEVESWIDPGAEENCVGILCDDCAARLEANQANDPQ